MMEIIFVHDCVPATNEKILVKQKSFIRYDEDEKILEPGDFLVGYVDELEVFHGGNEAGAIKWTREEFTEQVERWAYIK